ncbi:MAG: hypothetical protein QXG08_01215 [Candidatus Methanomethyliaceae archaeon]
MEYALSTVIITIALVAIATFALASAYPYAIGVQDAPLATLQQRLEEVASALSAAAAGSRATVYGVHTGKFTMRTAEVSPFNITIALPGGSHAVTARKVALEVQGAPIAAPPASNFTLGPPSMRILQPESSGPGRTLLIPLASVGSIETDAQAGATIRSVTVKVPLLLNFTASGTFALSVEPAGSVWETHTFEAAQPGGATLYVDGEVAISFSVGAGDKVRVSVEYLLISPSRR